MMPSVGCPRHITMHLSRRAVRRDHGPRCDIRPSEYHHGAVRRRRDCRLAVLAASWRPPEGTRRGERMFVALPAAGQRAAVEPAAFGESKSASPRDRRRGAAMLRQRGAGVQGALADWSARLVGVWAATGPGNVLCCVRRVDSWSERSRGAGPRCASGACFVWPLEGPCPGVGPGGPTTHLTNVRGSGRSPEPADCQSTGAPPANPGQHHTHTGECGE